MTRGVDHIELVALPVVRLVVERDALRLDGDAALALERKGIEHRRLHLALGKSPAQLNEPVGEGRFAVIDVRDNGKVTYEPHEPPLRPVAFCRARGQAAGEL